MIKIYADDYREVYINPDYIKLIRPVLEGNFILHGPDVKCIIEMECGEDIESITDIDSILRKINSL